MASSISKLFSAKRDRNSAARPREDEMPSLQVSVPGQATMSKMLLAPAWPSPAPSSALNSAGTSALLTHRMTKFCSTVVRTVSFEIRVPKIIRLLVYDRMPRTEVRFNRRNIFARDENRCQYCGKRFTSSELSLDHVLPRSRGGKATWKNIVCACTACNSRKGGRTPVQAGMRLVRPASEPRHNPVIKLAIGRDRYQTWKTFLNDAYWTVELKD